jgi:hypothetical protein
MYHIYIESSLQGFGIIPGHHTAKKRVFQYAWQGGITSLYISLHFRRFSLSLTTLGIYYTLGQRRGCGSYLKPLI